MRFSITYGQLFTLITLVWTAVSFVLYARLDEVRRAQIWRWLCVYICLVVIARFVYFPWHLDSAGRIAPLHFDTARILPLRLNLLPFVHLFEHYEGWLRNLIGNIAMFIPVGIFWPLCFGKLNRVWKVVLAGFGYSLLIELSQLLFYERSTDIDDLLCNTLGALLGALLFFLIRAIRRKRKERQA